MTTALIYENPRPLDAARDANLKVREIVDLSFARKVNTIPINLSEFSAVARHYPIGFIGDGAVPMAIVGLQKENLFLDDQGRWKPGVYVPAFVRRYPFIFANDEQSKQMVLCIDRAAEFIVDKGFDLPFFEADGQPSAYTKNCIEFCNNFELERQRTVNFVQILKDLDLFETKTATFAPTNPDGSAGPPQKIADYFGVSEEKLLKLPAEKYIELRDNGALPQIHAHLLSLLGWDRLVALAMVKQFNAEQAAAGKPPL